MAFNLKTIQKYRYTVILITILVCIVVSLALVFTTSYTPAPKPLEVTANVDGVSKSKDIINPNWSNIRIGTSKVDITKEFGEPARTETVENQEVLTYIPNPLTPLATHQVWLADNKTVKIKRSIDSFHDVVKVQTYTNRYGEPEVIRPQLSIDQYALYGYNVGSNNYAVAEVDQQNQQMYTLYFMTKAEYEKMKAAVKSVKPETHEGFVVEPI